jgi:hypothetical protein
MSAPWPNASVAYRATTKSDSENTPPTRTQLAQNHLFQVKFCAGFALVSIAQVISRLPISTEAIARENGAKFSNQLTDLIASGWEVLGICVLISGFMLMFAGGFYPKGGFASETDVSTKKSFSRWGSLVVPTLYLIVFFGLIGWANHLERGGIISPASADLVSSATFVVNAVLFVVLGLFNAKKMMTLIVDEKADARPSTERAPVSTQHQANS